MFFSLVLITALFTLIPFLRPFGVVGAVILLYFWPYHTLILLGVLLSAWMAFVYFRRRKPHAL